MQFPLPVGLSRATSRLGNDSDVTRIIYLDSLGSTSGVLRFNDHPDTKDIGTYFNTGGAGNDLTLYIQTSKTNVPERHHLRYAERCDEGKQLDRP